MSKTFIHPTAVLDGDIQIGENCHIGPHVVLKGPLKIGSGNIFCPFVSIGGEPEHRRKSGTGQIIIGNDNVFKDGVVIHRGTGARNTQIGNRCYLMSYSHVSHDGLLEDDVTLAHHVVLAGHCNVLQGANLGISTVLHQHTTVGAYAMLGMGSVVTKDIPPFVLAKGNPAKFHRFNRHVFSKLGLGEEDFKLDENQKLFSEKKEISVFFKNFENLSERKVLLFKLVR